MSFQKTADLLRLAELATARHQGVSLAEIEAEFGIDRRTAQRMTRALEEMFPISSRGWMTSGASSGNCAPMTPD